MIRPLSSARSLLSLSTRRAALLALPTLAALLLAAAATVRVPAQEPEATPASTLTVVDPYLLKIPTNRQLTVSAVITAAAAGKSNADGIMADGTSAAIAVYKTASSKKVTFSATNGAKVAAYSANFLTTAGVTAASVAVTPTKIGTSYYALALVISGVAPDAEHGIDTVVHAVSAGSTATASFSMLTLPTPIVLVHGLWGNQASLVSTEDYLDNNASFVPRQWLVASVCYSTYLAFDAAADSLPGHGTGCENTATQALNKYFSTELYPLLDQKHYVGGRVDAVVHSMGGLVARHYTATSGYKSLRNRMLGTFRNVITLDTPETGSALATELDDVFYNRTLQSEVPLRQQLWQAACGTNSKTTLEECFNANGLPLAWPGKALNTGAVASLIPGSRSIVSAPAADIFNTNYGKWYAISSDYKDGTSTPALLRDLLNTLIAATYPSTEIPPTTTSVLGTPDSDVIVTVTSQTATAKTAQTKEFENLQHTPAPSDAGFFFLFDSNNAVTTSAAVNAQVAYWLGLQSSTKPADEGVEETPASEPGAAERNITPRFLAPQRLTAEVPSTPVALGQPLPIHLRFDGPCVVGIMATQKNVATGQELKNLREGVEEGSGPAKILSQDARGATIEITPLQTGPVQLRISVLFADGGLAFQSYVLNGTPSSTSLQSFDLNRGLKSLSLVIEDRPEDRETFLSPVARYDGLRFPIHLADSTKLNLTVDQPEDDPVVGVDENGLIRALRPGTAVITGDLDGRKDSITVNVYSKDEAPAGYRRSQD